MTSPIRVLLVDDDADFRAIVALGLGTAGIEAVEAETAERARARLAELGPGNLDAILLDIDMPGQSGLELLAELRAAGEETPLLLVTSLEAVEAKVAGFDLGADDYVVKPIEIDELVARLRAVIRRSESLRPIRYGDLVLDVAHRRIDRNGHGVELSPREYDLLLALVEAKGEVVSREELLAGVWKMDFDPGTNVLDVHVGRLRKKLDRHGEPVIETVRGQGYRAALRPPRPSED